MDGIITGYLNIIQKFRDYMGLGSIMVFYAAFLAFFIYLCGIRKHMKGYLYYGLVWIIGVLNPISVFVFSKLGALKDFERFIWLLMPPVVIAAGAGYIYRKKRFLYFIFLMMILFSGVKMFNDTEYEKAQNSLKISSDAIEVSDIIMRDALGLSEGEKVTPNISMDIEDCPRAVVTDPLSEEIRMYNANIRLWFVREGFGSSYTKRNKKLTNLMSRNNTEIPAKFLFRKMRKNNFSYFVLGDWQQLSGDLEKFDIKLLGDTGKYRVYKYTPQRIFKLRHYADVEGYQCMSYTLRSNDGKLIVIDGGRAWQSLELTDTIEKYGGHVDAWIITHAHDDHMGVLASILEAEWDKDKISIDEIYLGKIDEEAVDSQGLRTDAFHYFMGNIEKRDNVKWLDTGDEVEVCGLKLKVLHNCNATVTENSGNILNDGSMVFKLSGEKKSILFLGDIGDCNENLRAEEGITDDLIGQGSRMGRLIADEILASYPDDVKSTYVQMAHHGNSLMPDYFYEAVAPKAAFFDAPDWLMENKNKDTLLPSYYTTPHYRKLMEDIGAKIITYSEDRAVKIR